ncbi:hypothetical protein GCM10023196_048630 [Actinoallomurus vinaceus]|uniref:DUF4179 domain-containing protein n=1 Tax=Actinoallomurus vinaceus TaxID=1080074 RepID=A0ABP8UFZ9_9ACTN
MSPNLEDELRATFSARAESVPTAPDPYPATARRIARARRRRRASVAGALAVTAVLAVGVPAGLHGLAVRDGSLSARHGGALSWPLRGSLAHDRAFLGALREEALRRDHSGDMAYVLYAHDDGRHRVAVVVTVRGRSARGSVWLGASGDGPRAMKDNSLFGDDSLPLDPEPIVWFAGGTGPLLVLGPPTMTDVKVSPAIAHREDGTPYREVRTVRADQGAVLTDVPGARLGQLSVKFRIGARYSEAQDVPYTLSRNNSPAYWPAVGKAVAQAAGHVDAEQARGLLDGTAGYFGLTGDQLTYRFWWGDRLPGGVDALVATIRVPSEPEIRVIQDTYRFKDGTTDQERYAVRVRDAADAQRPIGWTPAVDKPLPEDQKPTLGAVYVPNGAGVRVELWNHGTMMMAARAGATGLATFSPRLSTEELHGCEYHVVDGAGKIVARGGFGQPDLDFTLGRNVPW